MHLFELRLGRRSSKMREVFLKKVQLLLVVNVIVRRHRRARATPLAARMVSWVREEHRSLRVVGSHLSSQRRRNKALALRWAEIGGWLTGKKLSESSFCFANSFSSSSSMSNGTAPELRRAAELSPPRPPPKPPRPPRDMLCCFSVRFGHWCVVDQD